MPHKFMPRDREPYAAAAGGRRGVPPRKHTGIDLLEPPQPDKLSLLKLLLGRLRGFFSR